MSSELVSRVRSRIVSSKHIDKWQPFPFSTAVNPFLSQLLLPLLWIDPVEEGFGEVGSRLSLPMLRAVSAILGDRSSKRQGEQTLEWALVAGCSQ